MSNPQPFRISRTAKLTLPSATTLLLAVVVVLLVAATPRPAQALLPGGMNLYPVVSVDKSSVVVSPGQTATNSGTFYDPADEDRRIASNSVRVTASVGTITQSGIYRGTWNWSYVPPADLAGKTQTVTITATDSKGAPSSRTFSLGVRPSNDSFSGAQNISGYGVGDSTWATMEAGEPRPSSPTKDCGNTGVDNSVWFKFTYGVKGGLATLPSSNAYYNFDTQGSNFDTVLALYEGSSLGTLKQIECSNDNSLPNWNDNLSIPQSKLSLGKTYYVQLTGTGGARSGKYQLHYEPREPTVGSNTAALTASGRCSDLAERWYYGPLMYQQGYYWDGSYGPTVQSALGYCTASGASLPAAGEVYYAVLDITAGNVYGSLPTLTAIRLPPGTQFATDGGTFRCLQKTTVNDPWRDVTADPDTRCPMNPTQFTSDGTSAGAERAGAWDLGARRLPPGSRFQIIIPLRSSNPQDSVLVGHVEAPADPAVAHPGVVLTGPSDSCHDWSCMTLEQQLELLTIIMNALCYDC